MIVIIDDDPIFAEMLKENLKKYYKDNEIIILTYFDEEFLNSNEVEILFVDIELEDGKNGIDLASIYRRQGNDHVEIIFISTHENLEHNSHVAFPLYFIRKAHFKSDLIDAVLLLNERRRKREMPFMLEGKIVKLMDILYIESRRNNVFYHFKDGSKIKRRIQISTVEKELEKFDFIRCHVSYVVNAVHIKEYYIEYIILGQKTQIPIGEKFSEYFLDKYHDFMISRRKQSKLWITPVNLMWIKCEYCA